MKIYETYVPIEIQSNSYGVLDNIVVGAKILNQCYQNKEPYDIGYCPKMD
jgi:hypothetical protein